MKLHVILDLVRAAKHAEVQDFTILGGGESGLELLVALDFVRRPIQVRQVLGGGAGQGIFAGESQPAGFKAGVGRQAGRKGNRLELLGIAVTEPMQAPFWLRGGREVKHLPAAPVGRVGPVGFLGGVVEER